MGERCQFWRGTLASAAGEHDLILANLLAELLVEGAGDLAARLAPDGRLYTGGVLVERRPQVVAALKKRLTEWQATLPEQPSGDVFSNLRK